MFGPEIADPYDGVILSALLRASSLRRRFYEYSCFGILVRRTRVPDQFSRARVFITLSSVYWGGYTEALVPYQAGTLSAEDAWEKGWKPLRKFMGGQLEHTGNTDEILLFWRYSPNPPTEAQLASCTMEDVPTHVLLPAFMLS